MSRRRACCMKTKQEQTCRARAVNLKRLPRLPRLLAFAALTMMALPLSAQAECTGEDGGSSVVSEIRGGDTLIMGDGRSLRLAGALIPRRGAAEDSGPGAREEAEKTIA